MSDSIRVVVVDDSPFVCRLLASYLNVAPDVQVVGMALNGARAVALVETLRPDVVTLDLEMPRMSGLETLDRIMHTCPTPVVLISGTGRHAASLTLQGVNLGAVDFVLKYLPGVDTDPDALRQGIVAKVRAAARIHVIRSLHVRQTAVLASRSQSREVTPASSRRLSPGSPKAISEKEFPSYSTAYLPPLGGGSRENLSRKSPKSTVERVVVIGASTGGPTAVRELLSGLPPDFSGAILLVQHMPEAFTAALAVQLQRTVSLPVREAQEGDRLVSGTVLVAPGGYHLLLAPDSRVRLTKGPAIGGHRPSIDVTMQAVAQIYGAHTQGVVLTGMGADGAMGLVAIHAKGGTTFAQDAGSCVVDGMPQRAVDTGIVDYVAPPAQIAQRLLQLQRQPSRGLP